MSCCCEKKKVRSEESKKTINTRINRIIGSLNGIKNMVDEDRYCDDVLIQLAAIDKSIKSLATVILDEHLHTCIVDGIKDGDISIVDEITDLFKRFN